MNKTPTADFQHQLLAMRKDLLAQIAQLRGGAASRVDAAAEQFARAEDSPAQVMTARDLAFALDEHETAELDLIDAALARISAGRYGECTDCGVTIPLARLKVSPAAPRCIACQEKAERHA